MNAARLLDVANNRVIKAAGKTNPWSRRKNECRKLLCMVMIS